MPRSQPLPDHLGRVFTLSEAAAAGVGRQRLRAMERPTRGVRVLEPAESLPQHLEAFVPVLPAAGAFSHVTAARLLDLWLPDPWTPAEPVHVIHLDSVSRPRRAGVVAHPVRESRKLTRAHGLRVTTAAETWADLAAVLSLDDLVVLGDSTLRFRRARCGPGDLDAALARLRRGSRRAREARALVRPGSASPMETRVRLLAIRAGLPEPELNARILDEHGTYLGAFDLVWREARVIVEYDGDQHRTDRGQWQRDHRRLRAARAAGWVVIVLTADDVFRTPARTAELLREALGRPSA